MTDKDPPSNMSDKLRKKPRRYGEESWQILLANFDALNLGDAATAKYFSERLGECRLIGEGQAGDQHQPLMTACDLVAKINQAGTDD